MKRPVLRVPARVSYMRDAHRHARDRGMRIIRVKKVYHRAYSGEKAFVRHTGKLLRQDTWFYGMWPVEGTVLLVSSYVGHGPHHQRPTLYVYPQDIHDDFPLALYRRYLRWRWGAFSGSPPCAGLTSSGVGGLWSLSWGEGCLWWYPAGFF